MRGYDKIPNGGHSEDRYVIMCKIIPNASSPKIDIYTWCILWAMQYAKKMSRYFMGQNNVLVRITNHGMRSMIEVGFHGFHRLFGLSTVTSGVCINAFDRYEPGNSPLK